MAVHNDCRGGAPRCADRLRYFSNASTAGAYDVKVATAKAAIESWHVS